MYEYRMEVVSIVDGDTIHAAIDLGFDQWCNKTLRLYGINAPERGTPEGKESLLHLVELLTKDDNLTYRPCVIWTHKDKREKYGRYLATIFTDQNGTSVNESMVRDGFAVEYLP